MRKPKSTICTVNPFQIGRVRKARRGELARLAVRPDAFQHEADGLHGEPARHWRGRDSPRRVGRSIQLLHPLLVCGTLIYDTFECTEEQSHFMKYFYDGIQNLPFESLTFMMTSKTCHFVESKSESRVKSESVLYSESERSS